MCIRDSSEIVARRSLSADLGTELGESGPAATAVAPASDGTGTHADHEPTASGGAERRTTPQEGVVAGSRTEATGVVSVSTVGKPATARSVGVTGPNESDDRGADASHRAGRDSISPLRTKPFGLHVAMPRAGPASANASPRTRCATVGRLTYWRPAPTCAPSRFCSGTVIWKRPPSTCICRSGTCRQFTIRWTVSLLSL